jgi:hypothetical protein
VNILNDVGAGEDEMIVAPLQGFSSEVFGRRMVELNVRSHRAVVDEDAIGKGAEIRMGLGIRHDGAKRKKAQTLCAGQAL